MLKNLHCVRGTSFIFLFKADLRVMGRFERTTDPLLCEQKELSIVAKSFFHTPLRVLGRKCKQCRSQFVYNF